MVSSSLLTWLVVNACMTSHFSMSSDDIYSLSNCQDRFLAFGEEQHPIVLQIGGNDLENLAKATQLANPYGYDEINLKFVLFIIGSHH